MTDSFTQELGSGVNDTARTFTLTDVELGILCSVNILFSIIGTIGNIFVCLAFIRYRRLRNTMNVFILSLACSSMLVCTMAQPMFVVSLLKRYSQDDITNTFEEVRKCFAFISLLASAGNLLGVTMDRYYAIARPLKYGRHQQVKPLACVFVTIVWLIAISIGTSVAFYREMKKVSLVYVFVLVMCLILPFYIHVLVIAGKHRRRILASLAYTSGLSNSDQLNGTPKQRLRLRNKIDRSALITVGVICAIFVFGWFPLLILSFTYQIVSNNRELMLDLFQWINSLALCSSAVNPIVYSATDRNFRESLKAIYRREMTRRQDLGTTPKPRMGRQSNESS